MDTTFEICKDCDKSAVKNNNFDLMVFEKSKEYLCYVEAVHMLIKEDQIKECDFL